jgi:hypothetical protein
MAEFDDFPVKPKFQVGDDVYFYPEESDIRVYGKIRHIRATVGILSKKAEKAGVQPLITYGYTLTYEYDGNSNFTPIEEAALFFANPLLQMAREV